jgi:dTMP kinase
MAPQQGTFFAIEGIDGASRDAQFKHVISRLSAAGHAVESFDFSHFDRPSAYFVKQYMRGTYGPPEQVGPYTASLFYAMDHYEAAAKIRQALDEDKIVVTNHFIGANMGYQGAKFNHGEQRLGYFIWLDNMEFELLGIPRPQLNFVLRMPTEIAQQLAGNLTGNPYTQTSAAGGTQSIERAVEVYDDLCQLFPKDFTRIDCVRSGKLLDENIVATLIWEKLRPLLPVIAEAPITLVEKTVSPSPTQHIETPVTFEASGLLALNITTKLSALNEASEIDFSYYIPGSLEASLHDSYVTTMDSLRTLHSSLAELLTDFLVQGKMTGDVAAAHHIAAQTLRSVVPVASLSRISIPQAQKSSVANSLYATKLKEAQNIRKILLGSELPARQPAEQLFASKKWAMQQLSGNHVESKSSKLELTEIVPRNELNILPDMLYANTDRSVAGLQSEIQTWPYEQKAKLFNEYFTTLTSEQLITDPLLNEFKYSWDILGSFQSFVDLPPGAGTQKWQLLSPRHGYTTPKLIEEAGLSDLYDDCFYMSLKLYSALQAADHIIEAQYATLRGHELRYTLSYTAAEIIQMLLEITTSEVSEEYNQIVQSMYEKIAESHPLLASTLNSSVFMK